MKNPPLIISFVWYQPEKEYIDGKPVSPDLCIPIEGAVLATEIIAVSPEHDVLLEDRDICTIHLRNGSVLQCVEPAERIIKRWVGKLMRESAIKEGWNPS